MRRTVALALALAALAAPTTSARAAPGAGARVVCRFADPRIDEASGIGAGIRSPGVLYAQNDSGDSARFFAVDPDGGATVATIDVRGAEAIDWEDLAVAPDRSGRPSVWLADIGDNDAARAEVDVYRVDEPALTPAERGRILTLPAERWRLRYPGGPADAESFAVAPDGTGYVVTKSALGSSTVYRLPPRPDPDRVQTPVLVADLTLGPTGTDNPFGIIGQLAATGAAFSRDGRRFAVRTYADARVWSVGADGLAAALRRAPQRIALPRQSQGEGIAVAGDGLLLDSEGVHAPVWSVPLPATAGPAPTTTSSPDSPTTSPSGAAAESGRVAGRDWVPWLAGIAVVALVAIGAGLGVRAWRSRR